METGTFQKLCWSLVEGWRLCHFSARRAPAWVWGPPGKGHLAEVVSQSPSQNSAVICLHTCVIVCVCVVVCVVCAHNYVCGYMCV